MPRLVTSFDSVVLAAVAREVAALVGSRVARVAQPDAEEIAIDLRGPTGTASVLCSIHARWGRIHLMAKSPSAELSTFGQLLRSRLDGARLTAVHQTPFERILTLSFDTLGGRADLVAEIMGRHSNMMLVQQGHITGSLKTVPETKSAVRAVLPGAPYVPPPAERPSPAALTEASLLQLLSSSSDPLAKRLVATVLGLSPALAVELTVRARLDPLAPAREQAASSAALWTVLQDLVRIVQTHTFAPIIYLDGVELVGFAPFPYVHLANLDQRPASSMSDAVASVLGRFGAATRAQEQRTVLVASIRSALERVARTETEIRRALEEAARTGPLRQQGELLLAYAAQVPRGAAEVTLPAFDGTPLTIPLDPSLSAVQNAQRLFKRYGRVRSGHTALNTRLTAAAAERAYLESVLTLIEQASTEQDLLDLRQELGDEGYLRRRTVRTRRPAATAGPRRFTVADGTLVLVGRTNRENDVLTFKLAAPDDLWLHARGVPGAHVILKTGRKTPADQALQQAASIAAYFSQARQAASVPVDYTARRHVRKPKGAKPGLVTYTQEHTVTVAPALPDIVAPSVRDGRQTRT
jgi:predicted ribosome quality control (RQC) complex YloA/Tae2 family protein